MKLREDGKFVFWFWKLLREEGAFPTCEERFAVKRKNDSGLRRTMCRSGDRLEARGVRAWMATQNCHIAAHLQNREEDRKKDGEERRRKEQRAFL